MTKIKLVFINDKELLLLLGNNIRGGISGVMSDRNVESDEKTNLLYIDAYNLYGWAMSQLLPSVDFEKLDISKLTTREITEDLLLIPGDNESGFFIECDLEYPVAIKEKTFQCALIKQKQIQNLWQTVRITIYQISVSPIDNETA